MHALSAARKILGMGIGSDELKMLTLLTALVVILPRAWVAPRKDIAQAFQRLMRFWRRRRDG